MSTRATTTPANGKRLVDDALARDARARTETLAGSLIEQRAYLGNIEPRSRRIRPAQPVD